MEQSFLQQRIEERAKNKLLNDLVEAANKEAEISNIFRDHFKPQLHAAWYFPSYGNKYIKLYNDLTQQLFDKMLPEYIQQVTDEILRKIDKIDYLVNQKESDEYDN